MVKTEHKIQSLESSKPMSGSSPSPSTTSAANKKKYKGVRMRSWGSWVSEIRAPNQKTRIWLGSYSTPEAAARAYDAALLCLKGSSANFNFPISSSYYISDTAMSPKSIQRVAAAAANNFSDNATNMPPVSSPNLPSSSSYSSSSASSPPMSSSPSDQFDDDVSLVQSLEAYHESIDPMLDSWYDFDGIQSPKYLDPMLNGVSFNNPNMMVMDDYFYEADFRLWSFAE